MSNLPKSLVEKLSHGKYSSWAKDIDEDTLVALCWFVGEFAVRHVSLVERWMPNFPPSRGGAGLKAIIEIYSGRTFSGIDDIREYLHRNTVSLRQRLFNDSPVAITQYRVTFGQLFQYPIRSPDNNRAVIFSAAHEDGICFSAIDFRIAKWEHITMRNAINKGAPSEVVIAWTKDSQHAALFINSKPYAVFDFAKRRGYCKIESENPRAWGDSFQWDDSCMDVFMEKNKDQNELQGGSSESV